MRTRLLPALAAGVLAASLLGAQTAAAEPREVSRPSLPPQASQTAAEHAADALAQAQALFAEKSPAAARRQAATRPDATMVLNALMRAYDDLSPADKKVADRLLARPTAPGGDGTVDYQTTEATPVCSTDATTPICIHYVTTTSDAPVLTDAAPANGIPDAVDQALATAESVHRTYVDSGYRRPDPDRSRGGGSGLVDIYLADVGARRLYGYCTSDQPQKSNGTYNYWAYCVIDDDFSASQFGSSNTPLENQQVTLAHEYFHAVQFAYDAFEDGWIMEATATWAEEQVYDAVDDNRQYLSAGQISRPRVSLDRFGSAGNHYGNWIFFQFLTERWTEQTGSMPTLVLDVWKRMQARSTSDPDRYSTRAVQEVLAQRGAGFTSLYAQFAEGNRRPAKTYSEGSAVEYDPAAPVLSRTLSSDTRSTGKQYAKLDHLTSAPVRLKPDSGLTQSDWKLRVKVDMPAKASAPVARVAVYRTDGSVSTNALRFKDTGFSSKVVDFSAASVQYVEVVLVNASRRTTCWTYPQVEFACYGTPKDDNERFDYNASIFRS
jgi:hypothetical protein